MRRISSNMVQMSNVGRSGLYAFIYVAQLTVVLLLAGIFVRIETTVWTSPKGSSAARKLASVFRLKLERTLHLQRVPFRQRRTPRQRPA
jgi:hypothetical protein